MALFLNQTDQRSELQEKVSAQLQNRMQQPGTTDKQPPEPTILQESKAATGRSLFWAGVATMVVIALVVFVLFVFEGV